jgi:hypothetical protein
MLSRTHQARCTLPQGPCASDRLPERLLPIAAPSHCPPTPVSFLLSQTSVWLSSHLFPCPYPLQCLCCPLCLSIAFVASFCLGNYCLSQASSPPHTSPVPAHSRCSQECSHPSRASIGKCEASALGFAFSLSSAQFCSLPLPGPVSPILH